jgi:hypothetical protein
MRTRSVLSTLLIFCLVSALLVPSGSAVADAKKKKSGPKVVGTDDEGDWGDNAGGGVAPLGDALGQDLVEASFEMADKKTVNFIIKVTSLPPWGGIPESSRYTWDFMVDGDAFQLSGAFTEYLRGICNPLHTDSCPPPQDPGQQAFFLRQGSCLVGEDCHVRAIIQAEFDTGEATITIPVALEDLKAKPGSKIAPGVTSFGGTIYAVPAVIVTNATMPNDTMVVSKTFKVPGKKKKG